MPFFGPSYLTVISFTNMENIKANKTGNKDIMPAYQKEFGRISSRVPIKQKPNPNKIEIFVRNFEMATTHTKSENNAYNSELVEYAWQILGR